MSLLWTLEILSKDMHATRTSVIFWILLLTLLNLTAKAAPAIENIDRIRIAEAYRVAEKLQDSLWTNWDQAPFATLFVTDDYEFLIRHPNPPAEFQKLGYDKLLKSEVLWRPRKFPRTFLATFPAFDRTPVIVVGKAENTTDKTSTGWLFVFLHEHFHQQIGRASCRERV